MRRTKTRHTYCAHHGENQGHNTADCIVMCREFDRYYDLFREYLQTRGLGPYATEPRGRGHKRSRPHPSCGCGRGQGGGFRQLQPQNLPPDLPPDLPRGQFHNGPRHYFSASYPYGNINRGYSRWEAAARHWSPPREDAYGYGLAGYERSFGESPDGDFGGRYGFGNPPDDRAYFRQQRETTGNNFNYGLSAAGPDDLHPRLYGDGYDLSLIHI